MGKKIYTLPHRINESLGTQALVKKGLVEPIYDIDEFVSKFSSNKELTQITDEILIFCSSNPSYEEAISKFGNKIFEYELEGKIEINNAKVSVS